MRDSGPINYLIKAENDVNEVTCRMTARNKFLFETLRKRDKTKYYNTDMLIKDDSKSFNSTPQREVTYNMFPRR